MTETRREFLKTSGLIAAGLAAAGGRGVVAGAAPESRAPGLPWYRRTVRWGQTNIAEIDPERYDIGWWRGYWKRTQTQGVIVNAGGIVAYYPSQVPFHRLAEHLGGRDLFGE